MALIIRIDSMAHFCPRASSPRVERKGVDATRQFLGGVITELRKGGTQFSTGTQDFVGDLWKLTSQELAGELETRLSECNVEMGLDQVEKLLRAAQTMVSPSDHGVVLSI